MLKPTTPQTIEGETIILECLRVDFFSKPILGLGGSPVFQAGRLWEAAAHWVVWVDHQLALDFHQAALAVHNSALSDR
jgi:hypothetical protein